MSQPSFESASPTVLTKKSAWNIYTVMLLLALLSLVLAMAFLYLEIREYGGFGVFKGPSAGIRAAANALAPAWA